MLTVTALRLGAITVYMCLSVAAAVLDARTNRCPNGLAFAMALSAALILGFTISERAFLHRLAVVALLVLLLVAIELFWRRTKGSAGFGMGDIKTFISMLLIDPLCAFASLGVACLLFCVYCGARSRSHAPFLPFLVPSFAAILIMFGSCPPIL